MDKQIIPVAVPDLAAAGTNYVAAEIPEGFCVTDVQWFVGDANCTGTNAALTLKVQTGAAGQEVDLVSTTAHATNNNQEITASLTKTKAVEAVAAGTRVKVLATSAGGTTAAATGVRAFLTVSRLPWKP